jgi:hypothetical protein
MSQSNLLDCDSTKLEVLRLHNEKTNLATISNMTGISQSSISRFLNKVTYGQWWAKNEKPIASGTYHDHHKEIKKLPGNCFIITSAQNNSFVHKPFLKSLEVMAKRYNATILVGTFSYNKSGFQNLEKDEGEWFDPLIKPYICSEPVQLAADLIYCGELNILPTAASPLSGMHSYTKNNSGIFPHAKVQLESLPSHKGETPRILYTTGAVTQRNYIEKKAGQKASFHHVFGALFVEIDATGEWFVRQLIAETDSGMFYDLDSYYTPTQFYTNIEVEAINYGDIHAEQLDPHAAYGAFGHKGSMLDVLKPTYQLVHDVCDFSSRNHHNINDPYFRFKAFVNKQDTVEDDIKDVCQTLKAMCRPFSSVVVVESNHDLALTRWLKTADYRLDPPNAIFFLELQLAQYKAMEANREFSVFEYAVKSRDPSLNSIRFLRTDESFMICGSDGVECGSHGDLGPNGSRGSAQTYTRFGKRYNIGHSHSARIIDGVYQAGTMSKLDLGYNRGASNWTHSAIVTYKNGKRTIVTLRGNKWRV